MSGSEDELSVARAPKISAPKKQQSSKLATVPGSPSKPSARAQQPASANKKRQRPPVTEPEVDDDVNALDHSDVSDGYDSDAAWVAPPAGGDDSDNDADEQDDLEIE